MKNIINVSRKQKTIFGIILGFIFLLSLGLTYAYFTTGLAEQNPNNQIVTTGSLNLLYVDGPEIILDRAFPGMGVEKEFIVSNTGTYDVEYSINWKSLTNEIENDELVISLTCKRYTDYLGEKNEVGSCESMLPQPVGTSTSVPIKANIPVEVGITHEYTLNIDFVETSSVQNYNQGKTFTGEIMINEYERDETNVPLIESASINNLNLSARVTDNIGVVAYTIVNPGETPSDWEPVSSNKNLELTENVDDYDRILWVKNQTGTVVYRDLTPEGTVIVDPVGGIFPDEEVANASIYNIKRMSTKSGTNPRSIAGPLTYVLKYKQTVDLKDPVKEGHTFTGWSVDGTLSRITGKTFTMGIENTEVTASWDTISYTLTVNPAGGLWSGTTEEQEFTLAFGGTKEIATPTRKGYTFTGWTLTDGTNSTLESTTFTMGSANCTLTATWTINSYPWIAYHNKQNINDTDYTLVGADTESDSAVYNTQVTPSVKNYVGFTTPASQTITIDEDTAIPTKNKVNYNYDRNSYGVSYILDGGEASGNPSTLKYDQTVTLTSPSKTGYNFSNWSVSGTNSSVSGTSFTMGNADAILTANYTAQTYTLSFNGNGGTSPESQTITYGSTYGTLPTSTRTDYTFLGWFTSASGGSQVSSGNPITVTSNQTLYAHWRNDVAQIGSTYYESLQAAINAVPTSTQTTVLLLKNTSETITIPSGKNVIIDLNSKTLTGALTNAGTLALNSGTITNTSGVAVTNSGAFSATGLTASSSLQTIKNNSGGTLNVTSSSLTSTTTGPAVQNLSTATSTLSSCTITSAKKSGISHESTGTLNVTGGSVASNDGGLAAVNLTTTGKLNISATTSGYFVGCGVRTAAGGTVIINGGTHTGGMGGVCASSGKATVTVNSGTINSLSVSNPNFTMTGGNIYGAPAINDSDGATSSYTISAGTIENRETDSGRYSYAMNLSNVNATFNITGGTIKGRYGIKTSGTLNLTLRNGTIYAVREAFIGSQTSYNIKLYSGRVQSEETYAFECYKISFSCVQGIPYTNSGATVINGA